MLGFNPMKEERDIDWWKFLVRFYGQTVAETFGR